MKFLKFKAYCNGEMTLVSDMYWFEENFIHTVKDGIAEGVGATYKIMQCTGLVDKNGVDIYEGDIVNQHIPSGVRSGFIKWDDAAWILQFVDYSITLHKSCFELEVVGNIEEPNLVDELNKEGAR